MQGASGGAPLHLPLLVHPTDWKPGSATVTQNLALDAAFVPSETSGTRLDSAHLVVLDNFLDPGSVESIFKFLTTAEHDLSPSLAVHHERPARGHGVAAADADLPSSCTSRIPNPPADSITDTKPFATHTSAEDRNGASHAVRCLDQEPAISAGGAPSQLCDQIGPPTCKWERATSDGAGLPRTWGLKDPVLRGFAESEMHAKVELQSRLVKLYPEYLISHMPSDCLQAQTPASMTACEDLHEDKGQATDDVEQKREEPRNGEEEDARDGEKEQQGQQAMFDCHNILANAAVHGDAFSWHVDADPWTLPESAWTQKYGHYFNREAGKPLFVSFLLYLDGDWPRSYDAETLFLDTPSDTGIFVRPKAGRVVLMDQDVVHRLSMPSLQARRPRYSLVWKLVFFPTSPSQHVSIARPEWGRPTAFGSAAKAEDAVRAMAAMKRQSSEREACRKKQCSGGHQETG